MDIMLKVFDLCEVNTGKWNENLVHQTFIDRDAEYILRLKVSTSLDDTYVWGLSKDGAYNTQSGYKLAVDLSEISEPQ